MTLHDSVEAARDRGSVNLSDVHHRREQSHRPSDPVCAHCRSNLAARQRVASSPGTIAHQHLDSAKI
jgi:hypothetical protein